MGGWNGAVHIYNPSLVLCAVEESPCHHIPLVPSHLVPLPDTDPSPNPTPLPDFTPCPTAQHSTAQRSKLHHTRRHCRSKAEPGTLHNLRACIPIITLAGPAPKSQ